jgi:hypothetical protein
MIHGKNFSKKWKLGVISGVQICAKYEVSLTEW